MKKEKSKEFKKKWNEKPSSTSDKFARVDDLILNIYDTLAEIQYKIERLENISEDSGENK